MRFDEYQSKSQETAGKFSEEERNFWILISALGLAGEAGEVADYMKKVYGHGHEFDPVKLKKELGDVLWYIADVSSKYGFSLDEIAALNIQKLAKRYPDGFESQKSINRKPEDT